MGPEPFRSSTASQVAGSIDTFFFVKKRLDMFFSAQPVVMFWRNKRFRQPLGPKFGQKKGPENESGALE
jgi:hypothetical protein